MKNFIFTILAMFCMAFTANAQYCVDGHKFFDNWSVGVNGGVQTNMHDWNAPQGAVVGLHLDKQITPVYGLTFETTFGINNTANWLHPEQMHVHNGYAFDNNATFALGRVNLNNLFCGYNGKPRLFEVEALAGAGYGHGWYKYELTTPTVDGVITETVKEHNNDLLVKAGFNLNFNLGKQKAWTIYAQPSLVWGATNNTHGIGLDSRNGVFQAVAGVTYHFKTSNGKHHFTPVVIPEPVSLEVIREVPVEVVKEVIKEVEVEKVVLHPQKEVINFAYGSYELTEIEKAKLDELVKNFKKAAVTAYASYEDKTPVDFNINLSKNRAETVANYLRENGVEVVKCEGLGAVTNESNRIAEVVVE